MNLYFWYYMNPHKERLDVEIYSMADSPEKAREKAIKIIESDDEPHKNLILDYINNDEPIIIANEVVVSYGYE